VEAARQRSGGTRAAPANAKDAVVDGEQATHSGAEQQLVAAESQGSMVNGQQKM